MLTPTHLETLRALAVPGDLWGDVLAEYEGPARALRGGRVLDGVYAGRDEDGIDMVWTPARGIVYPEALTLPLTHPLARAHVARLMARGMRCGRCGGAGHYVTGWGQPLPCPASCSTGHLRPPRPAWHLLPADESPTGLPSDLAEHAAELLACHVARAAMGLEGVKGALGAWREDRWTHYRDGLPGHLRVWVNKTPDDADANGWALGRPTKSAAKGPETGPEGMAAADRAALAAGFALATDGGIVAPWPDVSEVRDGR